MARALDLGDLSLLVRALHQDVSALDSRLRTLETLVREMRRLHDAPAVEEQQGDLVVLPGPDVPSIA